jgi:hypothetical protein
MSAKKWERRQTDWLANVFISIIEDRYEAGGAGRPLRDGNPEWCPVIAKALREAAKRYRDVPLIKEE